MRSFLLPLRILLLSISVFLSLLAQQPRSATEDTLTENEHASPPALARSPAFSAEKYFHKVRVTPQGKRLLLSKSRPMKIARSSEG
ncbi:MAG TPA: hypothetical protein VL346_07425 [Acidobacteriaceae bacterium]|nr:hypothetical protein [Acidobacteriaceae bacterium]